MGIISDQEKLTRWHYNWVNSANPVTANSWRNMYVRAIFVRLNIAMLLGVVVPTAFCLQSNDSVKFISCEVVGVNYILTRGWWYVAQ